MQSDDTVVAVIMLFIVILVSGTGYFGYRQGRVDERKALTQALVSNIEAAYWDGYTDALTGMRKKDHAK